MLSAVIVVANFPKISGITKKDTFELYFYKSDGKI